MPRLHPALFALLLLCPALQLRAQAPTPAELARWEARAQNVTIIRDRIQALIGQGRTLEQIKAAKVTADYDPRWGTESGPWTTEKFVEAVYKTLQPATPRKKSP